MIYPSIYLQYIRRYISDISDIGDVRHDIDKDRYIVDISVLDRYIGFGPIYRGNIRSVAHAHVNLIFW